MVQSIDGRFLQDHTLFGRSRQGTIADNEQARAIRSYLVLDSAKDFQKKLEIFSRMEPAGGNEDERIALQRELLYQDHPGGRLGHDPGGRNVIRQDEEAFPSGRGLLSGFSSFAGRVENDGIGHSHPLLITY
jgi:hypothetical protein